MIATINSRYRYGATYIMRRDSGLRRTLCTSQVTSYRSWVELCIGYTHVMINKCLSNILYVAYFGPYSLLNKTVDYDPDLSYYRFCLPYDRFLGRVTFLRPSVSFVFR